jgi:hypothetical protein
MWLSLMHGQTLKRPLIGCWKNKELLMELSEGSKLTLMAQQQDFSHAK